MASNSIKVRVKHEKKINGLSKLVKRQWSEKMNGRERNVSKARNSQGWKNILFCLATKYFLGTPKLTIWLKIPGLCML